MVGNTSDASGASSGEMDASSGHDASTSHGKDAAVGDAGKGIDCDPRRILCKAAETPCPEGQVHEVIDGCYGPCVAITECPCDEAADCPHSETFTCWMSSGYCNYWGP